MNLQLKSFNDNYYQNWHKRGLLEILVNIATEATRNKYPDWFNLADTRCYAHRILALKFLFLIKIYSTTKKHNRTFKLLSKRGLSEKNKKKDGKNKKKQTGKNNKKQTGKSNKNQASKKKQPKKCKKKHEQSARQIQNLQSL